VTRRARPHHRPDPAKLAEQFAKWLETQAANDDEIDEQALRELARADAEQMKRARKR
jgi:hypothetical protein